MSFEKYKDSKRQVARQFDAETTVNFCLELRDGPDQLSAMVLTPRTTPTAPWTRGCAGEKGASGIFFQISKNRADETTTKSFGKRVVKFSPFKKSASGVRYYGFRYYNPNTGRWLSRDPSEEQGGVNLYGMVNNNPVNYWDYLGLRECPCTTPTAKLVKDDAGAECCSDEIEAITYEYSPFILGYDSGHGQLNVAGKRVGFGPNGYLSGMPGRTYSSPDTPKKGPSYRACPSTKKKLKDSIDKHKNDIYNVANIAGRNCVGWACERLQDAGFKPPASPNYPTLIPQDPAWGTGKLY